MFLSLKFSERCPESINNQLISITFLILSLVCLDLLLSRIQQFQYNSTNYQTLDDEFVGDSGQKYFQDFIDLNYGSNIDRSKQLLSLNVFSYSVRSLLINYFHYGNLPKSQKRSLFACNSIDINWLISKMICLSPWVVNFIESRQIWYLFRKSSIRKPRKPYEGLSMLMAV